MSTRPEIDQRPGVPDLPRGLPSDALRPHAPTGSAVHGESESGGLHLWPAATCLISELATTLDQLDGDALRRTDVILPTGRLATWLLAMLARRRQAFVPPRCLTRDEFISRHAPLVGDGDDEANLAVLSDLEEELLLAGLLKDGRYRHLGLGHAHEVRQLFAELVAWDLEESAWDRLAASIAADVYRSEQGLGTLQERVEELRDLGGRYAIALADLGATTPRLKLRAASRRLAEHLASDAPMTAERLFIAGFTSMEKMHAPLLQALARRPEAEIWITEPPKLHTEPSPVQLLLQMIDLEPVRRVPRLTLPPPPPLIVHRAPSVLSESAHALDLAAAAIKDGLSPSAIALLVTDDKAYGKALRTLLPGCDFATNVALASPLATTLQGTWLTAMLAFVSGEQSTPDVLALLTHPLTQSLLADGRIPDRHSRERMTGELLKTGVTGGLSALLASPALSTPTRQGLTRLAAQLDPLLEGKDGVRTQPLAVWAELFTKTVRPILLDGQANASQGDIGVTLSTAAAVESFLVALQATAARIDLPLHRSEFLTLVGDRLLSQEVRSVGDPLRGVQILSVEEARYIPFDLVIVLGAAEGQFPRAVPRDYLLDNFLKTRIGLPGWQLAEAIEDTTFLLLRARLPALALLYPATRGGEPVVRSRFIEAALVAGDATEHAIDPEAVLLSQLRAATGTTSATLPPWQRHAETRVAPAGLFAAERRQMFASPMSASALEGLIRCPYRFLLSRLGVHELAWAEDDDARLEGDWLHDVLEAFFTGKAGDQIITEPLDGTVPWDEFHAYAMDRLLKLTDRLAPPHAQDSQTLLHLRLKAWPAFVAHLMNVYDGTSLGQAGTGLREHRIGRDGNEVHLRIGESDVALTGLIDAVDQLASGHLITDYKRNYTPDKRSVMDGVAPQLPLYALALAASRGGDARPLRRAVIGYWSILGGTWEGVAAGVEARPEAIQRGLLSGHGGADKSDLEVAAANLMDLWSWRHTELFGRPGEGDVAAFSPDPSRCELCQLAGVCRKDDPETKVVIGQGDALNRRLASRRAPRPTAEEPA